MKITFLGTGTSQGVPIINCDCDVCRSSNPKNKRLRCSVMVETGGVNILIDTSMDMREQFLRFVFPRIDAVLYTHSHADHIFGLDELRRFNYLQKEIIPVFGNQTTIDLIRRNFFYALTDKELRPGIPNIFARVINNPFEINGIKIEPIPLLHGQDEVLGFRIGNFAYCTDVNFIPASSYGLLKNLDVLVIGALRERPHPKHFSLKEAVAEARRINAKNTYLTHLSHILDHEKHGSDLPAGCAFAFDGLVLNL